MGTDPLSERAAIMRESLQKSQTITDNVVSILGSFDHRLSALETAMRPTQVGSFSSSSFLFGYSENWGGKDKRICEKMEFWGWVWLFSIKWKYGPSRFMCSFFAFCTAFSAIKMADLGECWIILLLYIIALMCCLWSCYWVCFNFLDSTD